MKITTLVENTSGIHGIKAKHGLSLFIETETRNILFDMGSDELFLKNANELNINIKDVDTAILSHGHIDHGGALALFLEQNDKAQIYIQKDAFNLHYTKSMGIKIPIGIDSNLIKSSRIKIVNDFTEIDKGVFLFSDVQKRDFYPTSNKALYEKRKGHIVQDTFSHEQYLVIENDNKYYLISGCAHKGIINILDKAKDITSSDIDYCISGFHLYNPVTRKKEPKALLESMAQQLVKYDTKFYTCHCTGKYAYDYLKSKLLDKIEYLSCGMSIEI